MPSRGEHSSVRLSISPTPATAPANGLRGTENPLATSGSGWCVATTGMPLGDTFESSSGPAGPTLVRALEFAIQAIAERCAD